MTSLLPPLDRIPPTIAALADYEPLARARLHDNAWAYLTGGAADGVTLQANRNAFDALKLVPRVLADIRGGNTAIELLGLRLPHPVLLAPVAFQKLFHANGEAATAMAAGATGTLMVASTQASVSLEEIAAAGQGSPQWFQLYMQPERAATKALVERAEAANYRAIVVTVDAPVSGIRNAEQRVGFCLPPGVSAVNLGNFLNMRSQAVADAHPVFDIAMAAAPVWDDIAWLIAQTKLPVVLKGILSPDDGRKAQAVGAAAIIVSNHGGRTLDTQVPAIEALPGIAAALDGKLPILLDSGVRRGTDVLKALALGAQAVLIGRPYIMGLAAAGPLGVAHVIRLLTDELAIAMALMGIRTLDQVGPHLLFASAPRN
ncbi:MAG: glcD3 [Xanthobacteraceae bacterium]|nr:glcD3 [Xanthobacteraceae bacterium]